MAYCTNAQVAAEFKNLSFSSSTYPTDTNVDRFIAEADAEIDSRVGLKYQVPLTGSVALLVARQLSIDIVAERVRRVIKVQSGQDQKRQDGREGDTAKEARERTDLIVQGKMVLSDATLASSHDGVKSYNSDNGVEPVFDAETESW